MCGSFFLLALHCVSTNDWRWIGWMDHKAIHTRPPHHLHHRHRHHHHIIIIHHPSICPFVRPIYSPSLPGHVLSRSRSMFFFDLRFFFGVPFSRDRVLLSFFVFISFFLSHLHLHLHFAFIHVLSPPLQTLDNFCSRLFQIPVHSILIVSNPHLHRIHTIQAHIRFVFFFPLFYAYHHEARKFAISFILSRVSCACAHCVHGAWRELSWLRESKGLYSVQNRGSRACCSFMCSQDETCQDLIRSSG